MNNFIAFLIILIGLVNCDFQWGSCFSYDRKMTEFDLKEYLGTWFEIYRAKDTPFEKGDCTRATYTQLDDGSVKVDNLEWIDGKIYGATGKARQTQDPFRLKVTFSDNLFAQFFPGDYQVVDTDYKNYSIVYSCTNLLFSRIEYYWIMSRTPSLNSNTEKHLIDLLMKKLMISSIDNLRFNNQNEAFCRR